MTSSKKITTLEELLNKEVEISLGVSEPGYVVPNTEFPVILAHGADNQINKISRLTECYALAEESESDQSPDFVRILPPTASWLDAYNAARALECDVYKVIVRVGYSIPEEPMAKPYRMNSQLGEMPKGSSSEKIRLEFHEKVPSDFHEVKIPEGLDKKLHTGSHTTSFRCIVDTYAYTYETKDGDEKTGASVLKVFSDEMPWAHILKTAHIMEQHVFLIRARMTFQMSGYVKRERTFKQLRQR